MSSSVKKKTSRKRPLRPVDRTFSQAFQNFKPPEDLTVSQWAEKYRVLSRESSAEAGPWNNRRTPYLVEIMDAFTDPAVEKISLVASSQVGKSELELNIIGYIIDQDPGSILYIQPSLDDAKKFSRLRIAPMFRDSPRLRAKVADVKSRDSGNTILQKTFPGGMLTMVGSNSPSGLASTPARYVLGDERDRWALSAGTEGDPWKLAEARTTTFYNAKMVDVSTPTIKGASAIEKSFYQGTQERWCSQCPHCGAWHNIVFDNISFDYDTVKAGRKKEYVIRSIHWVCPSCSCISDEETMRAQPARWISENPMALERGHRSFWLNAFSSPWQPWEKIAYSFLRAKDDPEQLKTVFNTLLGELWEDRGNLPDEDAMLARREDYGTNKDGSPVELPEGVLVLTCGVDTQDDRLEYEVIGHGKYGETWGIKKGVIPGQPDTDEVWERLDSVLDKTYFFKDGEKGLMIARTFVDSGGHYTQEVYRRCKERLHKMVFAIKGRGGEGIPYTAPAKKVRIVINGKIMGQTWLYSLGVDAGKAAIMAKAGVQEPGPKYCHFPLGEEKGYDRNYFKGLFSEKLVQKRERGRTVWAWVKLPGHERNEPLDCFNYALAAFRSFDPDMDEAQRRLNNWEPPKPKQQLAQAAVRPRGKKNKELFDEW